ncbi:MAG: VOC family protein, partial [Burkholderiaceae bacterium]
MTAEHAASVARFVALRRTVADLRRAIAFYCDGLGFHRTDTGDVVDEVPLALGAQRIVLVRRGVGSAPAVAGPNVRFQHVAIVAGDWSAAFARIQAFAPVAISVGGPQQLPAASGGARAFKFRDPDGHPVELIAFAAGQGAACWRAQARRDAGPTLGIDHAAISVTQADRSIAFYQGLGFRLGARQTNRGVEQARLDGLVGSAVEVEVVALVPPDMPTPHLELLAYHTPAPTRGAANAQGVADQLDWQSHAACVGLG